MNERTPHFARLVTIGALALLAGVLVGRLELVAIGAVAIAVLALDALRRPTTVGTALTVSADRIHEGEQVQAALTLTAYGPIDQVSVRLLRSPLLRLTSGTTMATVAVSGGEQRALTVTLAPTRWGVHSVGPALVSVYGAGRLRGWSLVTGTETIRVLPSPVDFAATSAHPFTRALAGAHAARKSGDGVEPIGVRQFAPGDPLRRVNWRVTARRGAVHVTERRPERNAEVVLFLDTFVDRGPAGATTLDVAVRAAAGIADHYLRQMDRVGVVGFGGVMRWITAGSGRQHWHHVVEHLLGMNTIVSYAAKDVSVLPARTLPPRALVIALSPLLDERATGALADLARRGYGLVVVDTAPDPLFAPPTSWSRDLAQRIWAMERADLIGRLGEVGVPVVPWHGPGTLDVVLGEVARLHSRPRVRLQ